MKKKQLITGIFLCLLSVTVYSRGYLSEVVSMPKLQLVEITDRDITPACSIRAVRPNVVRIGGFLYVAYLQFEPYRTLRLLKLDENLNSLTSMDIYSGKHNPTDARLASADDNILWYPFETSDFAGPWSNFLNLAQYRLDSDTPVLLNYKPDVARGTYIDPSSLPAKGDELTDDPAPFFYNSRYYVITKRFEKPILPVRIYSSHNLEELDRFDLDLSGVLGKVSITVNSLVETEDAILLIAGVFNAPPNFPQASSDIIAVPLRHDLKASAGEKIMLSNTQEYENYVAGARYHKGLLYVIYDVIIGPRKDYHRGILKVFDKNNNYSMIQAVIINEGGQLDNHVTLEIMNDKIFVFYYTPDARIHAKILEWK